MGATMKRTAHQKLVHELNTRDFLDSPVWRYSDDEFGELVVEPIGSYPVQTLENSVVGVRATFANGLKLWVLFANFDLNDVKKNRHFLSVTFFDDEEQIYTFPRYFDVGFDSAIQTELSDILQMGVEDIFPISYDLTSIASGDPSILLGSFRLVPETERLTETELIELAVG